MVQKHFQNFGLLQQKKMELWNDQKSCKKLKTS